MQRTMTDLDIDHGLFSDLVEANLEPVWFNSGGGRIGTCFVGNCLKVGGYLCAVMVLPRRANGR